MTRKSIEKQVDAIVEQICAAHGLDPQTEVKGGQAECANALLWIALRKLGPEIVAATNPPAPNGEWDARPGHIAA